MNEYREVILEELKRRYPEGDIRVEQVVRNNGVSYDGVTVRRNKDVNSAPILPLQKYEEAMCEGVKLEEVFSEIEKLLDKHPEVSLGSVSVFDSVRDNIIMRMVNYEKNKALLNVSPHRRFLDLAITYRIEVQEIGTVPPGTVLIGNQMLESWGITEDELYVIACDNCFKKQKVVIQSMQEILGEYLTGKCGEEVSDSGKGPLYVARNESKENGAYAILQTEMFHDLAEQLETDIFVLPSSIHELVLVPRTGQISVSDLIDMVSHINETVVAEEEVLSNHVYSYVRGKGQIVDLCV